MGNQPPSSDKQRRSRNPKAPPSSPRVSRKPSEKAKDHYQDRSSTPTVSGEIPKIEPSVQIIKNTQSLTNSGNLPPAPALGSIRMRVTVPGLQLTNLSGDGVISEPPISVRYTTRGAIGNSSGINTINIRTPPLSPRENREYKIFHFVYNGVQKDLKVYDGTPVDLVWRTLFQQLGISYAGSNLDSLIDSISILDSDGCSVVFSPEHIPHNEKLFVYDCNLVGKTGTSALTTIPSVVTTGDISESGEVPKDEDEEGMKFCWDVRWNSLYCGYTLSDDNRTVTSGNTLVSRSSSMPILISNRAFKKGTGIFKWRILFKSDVPHYAAGIVSEEEISFPRKCASFGNHFPSVPWFYKTAPMGEKSISVILDTNKSKVTINGKVFDDGLPDTVYAALCFKMPFNVEAQIQWDVE